jgi:hypothetical protein
MIVYMINMMKAYINPTCQGTTLHGCRVVNCKRTIYCGLLFLGYIISIVVKWTSLYLCYLIMCYMFICKLFT